MLQLFSDWRSGIKGRAFSGQQEFGEIVTELLGEKERERGRSAGAFSVCHSEKESARRHKRCSQVSFSGFKNNISVSLLHFHLWSGQTHSGFFLFLLYLIFFSHLQKSRLFTQNTKKRTESISFFFLWITDVSELAIADVLPRILLWSQHKKDQLQTCFMLTAPFSKRFSSNMKLSWSQKCEVVE